MTINMYRCDCGLMRVDYLPDGDMETEENRDQVPCPMCDMILERTIIDAESDFSIKREFECAISEILDHVR